MIAEAPTVFYIHEPFSVTDAPGPGICNAQFTQWFTYITRQNEARFYRPIKHMLALRYNWWAALQKSRSWSEIKQVKSEYGRFLNHRLMGATALIKDPIAFFSAEWLAERFNMNVVITIRHPAAFVSSIKKLQWSHPFSHFLAQPQLLDDHLSAFISEIKVYAAREQAILDQAILLWRMIHYTIIAYQQKHPDWIFVRHEDLSRDPLSQFRVLFNQLDIEFSDSAAKAVQAYSGSGNSREPEAVVGSEATLRRDSQSNIWNWKHRLTPAETERVRKKVEDVSAYFYSNEDW
jgi:hypothetical protein